MVIEQNWLLSPIDFDNVSHDVTADLFMKVYTGEYTVEYWRALAYRMIKFTYVKKQRQLAMSQVFEIGKDPIKKEQLYSACASCINMDERNRQIFENKEYLESLPKVILSVMKDSKFNPNSADFLALHTSVALSLLYDEYKYYHLKPSLRPYVHILTQQVKNEIANNGFFTNSDDPMCNPDFENALIPDLEFLGLLDD